MDDTEVAVTRPRRWDSPLDPRMRHIDVEHLLRVEPFRSIDADDFPAQLPLAELLRNDARILRYRPGDLVVREGDYGHSAFLVVRGKLCVVVDRLPPETLGRKANQQKGWLGALAQIVTRSRWPEVRQPAAAQVNAAPPAAVFLQDIPRILESARTVPLGEGEFFGELAALTRSQRTATVVAETEAVLVELRWQGLRDLMRRTPAIRSHIERLYRQNSLRVHLRATPLLANLPAEELSAVAEATQFHSHGEFDWHDDYETTLRGRRGDAVGREPLIAEEGAPLDGVLLIRSGFARQSRRYGHGHRTVSYLGKGQGFGIAEAIEAYQTGRPTPVTDSLRALGYVDVLKIPQSVLNEHVFPNVAASELSAWECSSDATSAQSSSEPANIDQGLLEFLVERRLMNGQQAMVIDLDRCTRCDDCVRACAATHNNNPRFVRQGDRYGPVQIVHACMHCVDPVCMIGCPTGAIGRDPETGVVRINDQTCIGCATCVNSCPYDNIRMVEIRNPRGALLVDQQSGQPLVQAAKCDLCADMPGGPACQSACAHDALVRIDLGDLEQFSNWLDR